MPGAFLSGLGGKLADRWLAVVLTPAFMFWGVGLLAWLYQQGWSAGWRELEAILVARSGGEQIALLVAVLLIVVLSSTLVQRLTRPVIRLLEGYGWPAAIRRSAIKRRTERIEPDEERWQHLGDEIDAGVTARSCEFATLDARLRHIPPDPADRMPTKLGDALRAAERWPLEKYGLDPLKCWPAVWLTVPDSVRTELNNARAELDGAASALAWAVLACLWSVWAWWAAPAGLLIAVAIHRGWVLSSAEAYGAVLEATFDVHRWRLYEALRLPLPSSAADEVVHGVALTAYLWRGSDSNTVVFATSPQEA